MTEFYKSIKSILHERISSPFYGSLIVSWLIWNWKIVYVTFFVDARILTVNKIDYIINNCNDFHHLVTFPIVSTVVLLTIAPFLTNGAYWVTMKFDQWRISIKNEIEQKQLLTIEQSLQLRLEYQQMEEKFENMIAAKDQEINGLKQQNEVLQAMKVDEKFLNDDSLGKLLSNPIIDKHIDKLLELATDEDAISGLDNNDKSFLLVNDIVTRRGSFSYNLTEKGKALVKLYLDLKGE